MRALADIARTLELGKYIRLGKGTLEYLVTEEGPDHDKSFTAVAIVSGEAVAQGIGKSKREAEQSAARTAYEILATLK